MFKLLPISRESIPRAISRAERYRLLNEPREAESICRDILSVDPVNQEALICLVLALTDLFLAMEATLKDVEPIITRLTSAYDRSYYAGVAEERWAKSLLVRVEERRGVADSLHRALEHFRAAMRQAPQGNEDAILRWNTCVRLFQRFDLDAVTSGGESEGGEALIAALDDDVPAR